MIDRILLGTVDYPVFGGWGGRVRVRVGAGADDQSGVARA